MNFATVFFLFFAKEPRAFFAKGDVLKPRSGRRWGKEREQGRQATTCYKKG